MAATCDAELFAYLEKTPLLPTEDGRLPREVDEVIARALAIKISVVENDVREKGARRVLNFGHTLAHALENAMGYGTLLHGEAVAIGMVAAARWGEALGMTPEGTSGRIRSVLKAYSLMTDIPEGLSPDTLSGAMALDKKAEGKTVRTVILTEIGACTGVPLTPEKLKALL